MDEMMEIKYDEVVENQLVVNLDRNLRLGGDRLPVCVSESVCESVILSESVNLSESVCLCLSQYQCLYLWCLRLLVARMKEFPLE